MDRHALELRVKQIQQTLADAQSQSAGAQQEAASQHRRATDAETTLVASQIKLHDLEDALQEKSIALDQERQLLSLRRDVTDLMGALLG